MVYIMIKIAQYPQLKLIAWNRHNEFINEAEALQLYEVNWRFIDQKTISTQEENLINRLVRDYGNGVLYV